MTNKKNKLPEGLATETLAVRAGMNRSAHNEHSEALYLTSSFVFDNAAQAAVRFSGEEEGNVYARFTNPSVTLFEQRLAALEGAEAGIRVNVVNPDAVLRGSKIWSGEWLDQRASTYKTDKEGLEEMYRQRSMLKRSVLPEDIAEGIYFFASDLSAKSTGNILNVDAGNVQAFTR